MQKSSNINNYADLRNKTVASIAGSTNEKVLKKYAEDKHLSLQVVYGKDYAEAAKLVEDGKAAAFAMDDVLLFGLMANSKQSSALAVVGETLQVGPYACMVRKGDVFVNLAMPMSEALRANLKQRSDQPAL